MNAFTGQNGIGKTNILDAIYYLCLGKSFFNSSDKQIYHHNTDAFRISAVFSSEEFDEVVTVKSISGQKKEISISEKRMKSISEHVGRFPCVMIAPVDIQILLSGSEERRNFMNNTIVQYDTGYLEDLLTYNRLLKQRNALLKQIADNQRYDKELLDVITEKMERPSVAIHEARQKFQQYLEPVFEKMYETLSGSKESCKVVYNSQLVDSSMVELCNKNRSKDMALARTSAGIHKDDLDFIMNGRELKDFASQGQLKSYVLALKLSQYRILCDIKKVKPILLLDDIFDKLDRNRVSNLLALVLNENFGQVLITDTQKERIEDILLSLVTDYSIFTVENGKVTG